MRKIYTSLGFVFLFAVSGLAQKLPIPYVPMQFFNTAGSPLASGTVASYACGTTTPKVTYSNSTGTANTAIVQLNSAGRANIFLTAASCYRFKIFNSAGSQLFDTDNIIVYAGGGGGGSGTISEIDGTANQVTVTNGTGPTVTLSLPQDIGPGSSPIFNTETLSLVQAGKVVYADGTNRLVSTATFGFDGTTLTAPASTFTTPTGNTSFKLGALTSDTAYNALSLNTSLTGSTMLGFAAGKTGDTALYAYVPSGGVFTFNFAAAAATRTFIDANGILTKRNTEANTAVSGAPHAITADDSFKVYDNEGATAKNYQALPTAVKNLTYTVCVQDSDGLRLVANTGDTLRIASLVTSSAGYIESTTIGSCATVLAINATEWVATELVGTWDVSS